MEERLVQSVFWFVGGSVRCVWFTSSRSLGEPSNGIHRHYHGLAMGTLHDVDLVSRLTIPQS